MTPGLMRTWCLAAALATAVPAAAQPACTPLAQATFVRDTLDELYLWYRELPDADPSRYSSPEQFLEAVRFRPLDTTFSYVTSRAANDAFFSESQFIGLGVSTTQAAGGLRVLQVFDGSPAADAGLDRGTRIEAIDGASVDALLDAGTLDAALGPAVAGLEVALAFTTRDGRTATATLTKRVVTIPTVSLTRVFDVAGRRVGYLHFRNFVRPSIAALDEAFATLAAARVDELVLDVRYNGGGLVDVAGHLASLIAGTTARDEVFAESRHNDRNRRLNTTLRLTRPAHALPLPRLVVLTSRASASASELVINGLRPFLPVVTIGDRTYGKPVGQYGLPFCDKVLAPVAFAMVNADGAGDYFDGIPATCPAVDDLEHDLGSPDEGLLAEALRLVRTGACSPVRSSPRARAIPAAAAAAGWRAVVNAY